MGSQSSRIAAYKMGFDYVGCELDKEYFDKGCERFDKECKGKTKTADGHIIKQTTLW
jgi:site-specific DNA-methyltransferase (adenine-specific)